MTLTLYIGEAEAMLPSFDAPVDAWFLDGFAPAKNPAMWSDVVLREIGRISAPDATLATFTAARAVRDGLQAQGFAMQKIAGYGHKRTMLVGARDGQSAASMPPTTALVIGGGIAGCSIARALAERGVRVTVLERTTVASGASGNPAAVLFPPLPKRWTLAAAWYFTALSFMLHQVKHWPAALYGQPGILRLPRHGEEEKQLRDLQRTLGLDADIVRWMDCVQATAQAGISLATGAAFFPQGTWISPAKTCAFLLQHPLITLQQYTPITTLVSHDGEWEARTADGTLYHAQHMCVAAAQESLSLLPALPLTLNAVAGQVSIIPTTQCSTMLRSILCHKGYAIAQGDYHLIGATYDHADLSGAVTETNHRKNADEIATVLPGWLTTLPTEGRTSLRATTPDRLPYIGQLAPGLWLSTGHGSRGMLSSGLAAEMIASGIMGELSPVSAELRAAVAPQRFLKGASFASPPMVKPGR